MNGSVNKVILLGNLGDNIKLHIFSDNNKIARFPLATSDSYTDKESKEKKTITEWHNIVTKNKLAEICEKHLKKGDKIYLEGKIKSRKWEDDGQTHYITEIIADKVQFIHSKKTE